MKKASIVILFLILCTTVGYGFYQFALVKSDNVSQSENAEVLKTVDPLCDSLASPTPKGIERSVTCDFAVSPILSLKFKFEGNQIQIYNQDGNELIQIIELNEILSVGYGGPVFKISDDINFDGYKDLWVRDGLGVLDNTPVTYWIYNKDTKKFEMDSLFQGVSNPVFDYEKKEIKTNSRCCAGMSWSKETYSFINGQYVLSYSFSHDYDPSNPQYATEAERALVDGVFKEVSVKKVKVEAPNNVIVPIMKTSVPFELVKVGSQSTQAEAKNIVVDSKEKWQEVWRKTQVTTSVQTAPEIDFTKKTVIAVFMGTQMNSGFSTTVSKIEETPKQIEVTSMNNQSGNNCMNLQVITEPFYIVQIAKTEKPVVFTSTPKVIDCDR